MKILTKMSIATLGANPSVVKSEEFIKSGASSAPIARIYGIATGLVFKVDPKTGDVQTAVSGNFEAVNLADGEVFRAGVLWLPSGIQELLINSVDSGEADANGKPIYNEVKFGFTINAHPAKNPIGYSYSAEQLIDAEKNDPLADLRGALPQLPAPTAKAPETAAKK